MRLLVHEPMNTTSTGWPAIGLARLEAHVLERALEAAAGAGVSGVLGEGTRPVIGMPMPGLVP